MPNTIENLRTALIGESTACATYAAYASKALQEGYPQIAKLFEATSKAERIHAGNHMRALAKLGGEVPEYEINIKIGTTLENLKAARAGEVYEFTQMYPPMIAQAETEGETQARTGFTWAMETEKSHARLYAEAIRQLESGEKLNLPAKYWVCPLCGETFGSLEGVTKCHLCNVPTERFIEF